MGKFDVGLTLKYSPTRVCCFEGELPMMEIAIYAHSKENMHEFEACQIYNIDVNRTIIHTCYAMMIRDLEL
jgi:hypothetical protein